jgi:hypothetical protein
VLTQNSCVFCNIMATRLLSRKEHFHLGRLIFIIKKINFSF